MLSLELGEELHQSLHTLLGHGVIDGGPETAHRLVALQVVEAGLLGGGHHGGIQHKGHLGGGEDSENDT